MSQSGSCSPIPSIRTGLESRRPTLDRDLVAFIDEASGTIDVAVYKLDLADVVDALARAKDRGARVRLVTDSDSLEKRGEAGSPSAFDLLRDAGIPVITDDRSGTMHNKFVIRDGDTVWTGSWNMTGSRYLP